MKFIQFQSQIIKNVLPQKTSVLCVETLLQDGDVSKEAGFPSEETLRFATPFVPIVIGQLHVASNNSEANIIFTPLICISFQVQPDTVGLNIWPQFYES